MFREAFAAFEVSLTLAKRDHSSIIAQFIQNSEIFDGHRDFAGYSHMLLLGAMLYEDFRY